MPPIIEEGILILPIHSPWLTDEALALRKTMLVENPLGDSGLDGRREGPKIL